MSVHDRSGIAGARRVVVKVGSSSISGDNHHRIESIVDALAAAHARGTQVVLVSSGAIATALPLLNLDGRPSDLATQQAAAAVGQNVLMWRYQTTLERYGLLAGQVLLTAGDLENAAHRANARRAVDRLLGLGVLPIVNENDTVATHEIRFGDNDRLGARVAEMISADTLVLLSDIDGFYTGDPRNDPAAVLIPEIREITPAIEAMAGGAASALSNGGMATKLIAGRIALAAGCRMAIADGRPVGALGRLAAPDARCTWFVPDYENGASPLSARKKWIRGSLKTAGTLTVDDGAVRALSSGKSLLPAGVTGIDGDFRRGDVVDVKDRAGRMLARGLVAYAADDARRIAGRKSAEIERLLGFRGRDEMVHRDDLVVE